MHMVARDGNKGLAQLLRDPPYSLNIEAVDGENLRPIHHTAIRGHCLMVRFLHECGARLDGTLEHASSNGNLEVVEYALGNGAGADRWRVRMALFGASRMGYEDVVYLLLVQMMWNV